MTARRRKSTARRGSGRGGSRVLTGGVLLLFGFCAGILLGAVLDGPRVFVRRWTEEVRTLDLATPPTMAGGVELAEFEALQVRAPAPPEAEVPDSAPPAAVSAAAPETTAEPAAPAVRPEPDPAPAAAASPPDARALIAAIKQRQGSDSGRSKASPPSRGAVVQVAAYGDAAAANALVEKLKAVGFDSYVSAPGAQSSKFRVRVRPTRGSAADALASSLEKRGYSVWVTKE